MNGNIEYEFCGSEDLFDAIKDAILGNFPVVVAKNIDLDRVIAEYTDVLRDDLYFVIEYPYVDKVYRNSYYNYFASKHGNYQRDCIRVSIFSEEVDVDKFMLPASHAFLQQKFLGYFVLRPIRDVFGRSLIDPRALDEHDFKICMQSTNCSVLGVKLSLSGFPHCSQDRETITCSETTLWAVMEYFGNKYADYKPVLPSQIIKTLESHAMQRQLPAGGLTMDEISFALKQFGFGPRLYSAERYDDPIFEIADIYVESGIPVLTGLASKGLGHVVVLIGKQWVEPDFAIAKARTFDAFGRTISYFDSSDLGGEYVVQDDNPAPYRVISLDEPGMHYEDEDSKAYKVDHIVVPLYPKVYLEAYVAKSLVIEILMDQLFGFDFKDNFVLRFFLTSSRSFKSHVASTEGMPVGLKQHILITKMPKFIWVAEIYNNQAYAQQPSQGAGLIILDATEAKTASTDALIFAAYPDRCVGIIENNFVTLPERLENYTYFNNLA
ncbi:hypothetical protein L0663_10350 [Dyadobacter sp. CY107]|uniref:hypothetical protein n=1 Tax=Dyadobacter fanqingshengii TaxID=2906443 RepID=UPI001F260958|nr:hypothetical protein [Dyadobacter fanqingshengii]MCF2503778.1 hypothetical protein [Dyadobacter fanqingshengii]